MKKTVLKTTALFMFGLFAITLLLFTACGSEAKITNIEMSILPAVTEYTVGDTFSAAGGQIKVKYDDGSEKTVLITDDGVTLSSPNMVLAGEKTVTVYYGGATTNFKIKVLDDEQTTVTGIEIKTHPSKINYIIDDAFDPSGGSITVTYADTSSEDIELTDERVFVSSPNMFTTGKKLVTVTYRYAEVKFQIKVSGEGDTGPEDGKAVKKIEMKSTPEKTEYFVGDSFESVGGVITITFADDTSSDMAISDESVSLSDINMSTAGQKRVTVTYQNKRAYFNIYVLKVGGVVTFDYNYDGIKNEVKVAENRAVIKPTDPIRENYTFYNWYMDEACTVEYDFSPSNVINGDTTVYAYWKQNGATYFEFTYDFNYYGVNPQVRKQLVKSGDAARLITDPLRDEFTFNGWYVNSSCTNAYVSGTAISDTISIYAGWTKTKSGSSTYLFEAEHTDLTGKSGPGFSGSNSGGNMIVSDSNMGASNGKYVSYLYRNGNSLEFHIASSESVTDATVAVSMAADAEVSDISINSNTYLIKVNGTTRSYSPVFMTKGASFSDAVVLTGIELRKGYNIIQLVTNNNVNPAGEGVGIYEATAPIVDCIKITTTSVITWDGNYGLPKSY